MYAAVTKDAVQRSIWTFYETVKTLGGNVYMSVLLREELERILIDFVETLGLDKVSEDAFEDALQDALDATESLLLSDRISPDWLMTEYEVAKDTTPDISTEDLMTMLAESINEKLKDKDIDIL